MIVQYPEGFFFLSFFCLHLKQSEFIFFSRVNHSTMVLCGQCVRMHRTLLTVKIVWQTCLCSTEIVSIVHRIQSSCVLGSGYLRYIVTRSCELKASWSVVSWHNMRLGCAWKYTLSKHTVILTRTLSEDLAGQTAGKRCFLSARFKCN